nr:hypothetical protein [uncultured Acidocella sp.]
MDEETATGKIVHPGQVSRRRGRYSAASGLVPEKPKHDKLVTKTAQLIWRRD